MNLLSRITTRLILASQSPRRKALLEQIRADFRVHVSPADETTDEDLAPTETARVLAQRKAEPVAESHRDALVLAADTVVIHEGDILGKPTTAEEAYQMLLRLNDDTHTVYTGLALHHHASERRIATGKSTTVQFGCLSETDLRDYVETKSPMDKAGSYGIQDHTGPLFVKHLEGDYYNVVGLPLRRLYEVLRDEYPDLLK